MNSSGFIIALAYPETVVRVSNEWFSPFLRFMGIGKKHYVKAGHAGLVLIDKETGILEYHDFGRYITTQSTGRVRGKDTDNELDFLLKAQIEEGKIKNLDEILKFLATNPKLIHGEGKLIASVCDAIDYDKAIDYITTMQQRHFIRYGVFIKGASNCSRFVTTTIIASVTNESIKKKLIKSTRFTPSTVGNVVIANTGNYIYEVSDKGEISKFTSSVKKENIRCFLDRLKDYEPSLIGNQLPKSVDGVHKKAQWLGGVGAGAWFELHKTEKKAEFNYRNIAPSGHVNVQDVFVVNDSAFNYQEGFNFVHYSNCKFFHVEQNDMVFRFDRKFAN
ncbi:MAG: hypothetical protein DRI75_01960 [Bacteroidetes bacterium]|nr:MAG: hypothetical protein DRI75_01960 [Bacteroidota bacterium]